MIASSSLALPHGKKEGTLSYQKRIFSGSCAFPVHSQTLRSFREELPAVFDQRFRLEQRGKASKTRMPSVRAAGTSRPYLNPKPCYCTGRLVKRVTSQLPVLYINIYIYIYKYIASGLAWTQALLQNYNIESARTCRTIFSVPHLPVFLMTSWATAPPKKAQSLREA